MDKPTFPIGFVVSLKSGGPLMTVEGTIIVIDPPRGEFARAAWFDGSDLCRAEFPVECLAAL